MLLESKFRRAVLPGMLLAIVFGWCSAPRADEIGWQASGTQGAVSAGGAEAVAAGIEILQAGGNAADGAVATILALSVVESNQFCFGGEVPILVYDAKREVVEVVAGMGTAPALATREFFEGQGGIPANGVLPAAVPAALDACVTTLDRYGTLRFADVAAPTLRILDRGDQAWHPLLARTLRRLIDAEVQSPDRSRGLRLVADYFYRGPLAHELAAWSEANGGLIRYSDLARHVTRIEEPATATYRGRTVCKCGPWTQGPYLLQTLSLLDGFDLAAAGHNSPDAIHLAVESMKLALADRDVWYGDPLFVDVPLPQLLSSDYTVLRRKLVDPASASQVQQPGDPRHSVALLDPVATRAGLTGVTQDTTTCVVADRWGNVVAATPSGWSGVQAGETGVWLGSRLQSFNTWKGHPNCIAPGKRPRITLTPTLILNDGKPELAVSVAGGDGQDQATLSIVLNSLDFGQPVAEAVTAPRFGTNHFVGSFRQAPPQLGSLLVNEGVGEATVRALTQRGHHVSISTGSLWAPSAIRIDRETGRLDAAGDPGAGRHAAAY
jgi:gamma-glutamyltranspeptidase / glutathione hydrolase